MLLLQLMLLRIGQNVPKGIASLIANVVTVVSAVSVGREIWQQFGNGKGGFCGKIAKASRQRLKPLPE